MRIGYGVYEKIRIQSECKISKSLHHCGSVLLGRVARLDFFRSKFAKSGPFQSRLDQKKIIWTFGPLDLSSLKFGPFYDFNK